MAANTVNVPSRRKSVHAFKKTEAEMMSQIEVRRPKELFETLAIIFEPEMKKLGYVCKASTSKVQDDSVIVTPESICTYLTETVENYARLTAEVEKEVNLNVNIRKQEPRFTNTVKIFCTEDAHICLFDKASHITRHEEVLQPSNISILRKERKEIESFEKLNVTVILEKDAEKSESQIVFRDIQVSLFILQICTLIHMQKK